MIALRNPSDRPQAFGIDAGAALELPAGEPRAWTARPVYAKPAATLGLAAGRTVAVTLAPFELRVWDLAPAGAK